MQTHRQIRTVNVTRYVTPLREGGSMPSIAGADDGFLYVIKFCGAGQGAKALIAELIGGEIAKLLQLKIPEIVFANPDAAFGRTEPHEEMQDLHCMLVTFPNRTRRDRVLRSAVGYT